MSSKEYITHDRKPFFELARPFINPQSAVLDIGPGRGDFAEHFGRTDFHLLEGNAESVSILQQRYPHTVYGRLPKLPFNDRQFDVIHCSHVVEHLQEQEFYDTLVEMDRCLKPLGVLVISAPMMWEGFYNDLSHVKPYNPAIYRKYLCSKSNGSLTRTGISSDYEVVKLQYRYRHHNPFSAYAQQTSTFTNILAGILRGFGKLGVRSIETTGYTIILRKGRTT